MNIKDKKLFPIVIAFAVLSALIAVVIWAMERRADQYQQMLPATSAPKTYHNEKYSFEFQYPENWTFHPDTFHSPFSKFNLVGASPEENGHPNPIVSPLLINIVTPDFAERAVMSRKNLGAIETDIVVGEVSGKKYEYTESVAKISVDLPFGEYRMILGADKKYEDVFNQILASFKFLK